VPLKPYLEKGLNGAMSSKTFVPDRNKMDELMDGLSNHIIDMILENPKKYLLKPKKKGTKVRQICRNRNVTPSL
jgi:hypothetical protein